MRGQTIAQACAAILVSLSLAACGGASIGGGSSGGSSSSSSGGTTSSSSSSGASSGSSSSSSGGPVAANVLLYSSSPTLSSTAGATNSSVTLTVTVTDEHNITIPGYPVSFRSDGGVLTPNGTVTDSSGNISAVLSAGSVAAGKHIDAFATASPVTEQKVAVTVTSTTPSYALGSFSTAGGSSGGGGGFNTGVVAIGQTPLAAGGITGLQVSLVDVNNSDTPFNNSATVTFSSLCQSKGLAQITTPVTSSTGTFSTTYKATGCNGNDTITSVTVLNGSTISASGTVNVLPASLGSILFDSTRTVASSTACSAASQSCTIGLRGTGLNEAIPLFFEVVDSNGNPVPNQAVNFKLTTTVGGLSISPQTAVSDSSGEVSTTVASGTVHTSVQVIASIPSTSIASPSYNLTVSTGVPTQNNVSLAATQLNLIGDDVVGNTSTVTVQMSDRYQNPVPDGMPVSFQTECGQIQKSCTTTGGACSVTFKTGNQRTSQLAAVGTNTYKDNNCAASPGGHNQDIGCNDHRCTVTAYALGEESFNDCNGLGRYISKANSLNNSSQCPNGDYFISLPEVFYDFNESGIFNGDFESSVDFNTNGKWDTGSGKFVGLLCSTNSSSPYYDPNCDGSPSLEVSKNLVIVMTSTQLQNQIYPKPKDYAAPDIIPTQYVTPGMTGFSYINQSGVATVYPTRTLSIPQGCAAASFNVLIGDSQWQVPPVGTTISSGITTKGGGSVVFGGTATVGNTDDFGYYTTQIAVAPPATGTSASKLTDILTITTVTPASSGGASSTIQTGYTISYPASGTCP